MSARHLINPFHELYVTEIISADDYVDVFSEVLISHALELFQTGNVILRGVQGSGKSMLLSLLKPEIRIAYASAGRTFPIPEEFASFIGAGINLSRSGAIAFGQRPIDADADDRASRLPLYFSDFVNYFIVHDIFRSLRMLFQHQSIAKSLSLDNSDKCITEFIANLKSHPCWFGFLKGATDWGSVEKLILGRLGLYQKFFNYNVDKLPTDIRDTKTTIGEPISCTVKLLWDAEIVPRNVPFYIRVDQYEQLLDIRDVGELYANAINTLLGTREPRVSYRIGVRHYAWRQVELRILGTTSVLEKERNYRVVDLDGILRTKEHANQLYSRFAEDVFRKRIQLSGFDLPNGSQALSKVLGTGHRPQNKVNHYVRTSTDNVVDDADLPTEVAPVLRSLAATDPLSAKLGEAWTRQQIKRSHPKLPSLNDRPWERKPYWKKERIQQALMQIAAKRGQRLVWAGRKDVMALSAGNILVFVSICQQIWAAWLRSVREQESVVPKEVPTIEPLVQNEGIQIASEQWHDKIVELPNGHARQRFLDVVGRFFREKLLKDQTMSYPGENGFSLSIRDLEKNEVIRRFLDAAVDYAALMDRPHTTKNKDRARRRKWYLNPVLSPYYQVPVSHTKEPFYATPEDVREWLEQADVLARQKDSGVQSKQEDSSQRKLFET